MGPPWDPFPSQFLGMVRADLVRRADGAELSVFGAHISSGSKTADDEARARDVGGASLVGAGEGTASGPSMRESFAECATRRRAAIFCMDANVAPDQGGESSPWRLLRGVEGATSVWDAYFHVDGELREGVPRPLTTSKMRGPLSDQPKKIGEHALGAIDQVVVT